jgi:hypothetical protein
MRPSASPSPGLSSFAPCLFLVGLASCVAREDDVVVSEAPDVGTSLVEDVARATSTDTGLYHDAGLVRGIGGTEGLTALHPEALGSGQMTVPFSGEYNAATRELSFQFEESEVPANLAGGLRTRSQALWCSSRLTIARDGVVGSNPPNTFELETGSIGTYGECGPGTYPDGKSSAILYSDLSNSEGALCANITVRSFYSVPFESVYAWIYEVNPIDNYAYTWGDRVLDGLGNGSEPPTGDNAPSDNRGGLFYYGDLTARVPGLPVAGSERTVNWVFRYPIDGANFNFRGLLVARFIETCNGIDDDCDGSVDEGGVCSGNPCCFNGDCDGVCGTAVIDSTGACAAPALFGAELCDGVDNDCDGSIDEGALSTFYRDQDGDTYGALSSGTVSACSAPSGFVSNNTDCNDGSATIRPGATEIAGDDVDQNCDAAELCFVNADNDGYRLASTISSVNVSCGDPGEARANMPGGDCDDGNPLIYPGRAEVCNGVDDDCDGFIDEGLLSTFYRDQDGDTYGALSSGSTAACVAPTGYVSNNTDCDDSNSSINPGQSESCNGFDDDCDGDVDEDNVCGDPCNGDPCCGNYSTYYLDNDSDGYGSSSSGSTSGCSGSTPSGYSSSDNDRNDSDGSVNPGAGESCNGIDDDCDGSTDEDDVCGGGGCIPSSESCNGFDDDCDGDVDEDNVCGGGG